MSHYPLADMLTRIRNGIQAKHPRVIVPNSGLKQGLAKILNEQGFIRSVKLNEDGPQGSIEIELKYLPKMQPIIRHLQCVSRPGRRVYFKSKEIQSVRNGLGVGVYSTPKGILTDKQAVENNVGGEYLCEIW